MSQTIELQPYVFLEDVVELVVKVERHIKRNSSRFYMPTQVASKVINPNAAHLRVTSSRTVKPRGQGSASAILIEWNRVRQKLLRFQVGPKTLRDFSVSDMGIFLYEQCYTYPLLSSYMIYFHMIKYYFTLNSKSFNHLMTDIKSVPICVLKVGIYNFIVSLQCPNKRVMVVRESKEEIESR